MSRGEILELDVIDLNNLGCGVARHGGKVVFVKGAVTGDTVRTQVIKENKSFLVGKLVEIVKPSPHRAQRDECTAPLSCGGCVYRHVTYSHEKDLKRDYVKSAFVKAGLGEVKVLDTVSADKTTGYRNKAQFPVCRTKNGLGIGFYATKTHTVIPSATCAIQHPEFSAIAGEVCRICDEHGVSAYNEETGKGVLRHIYLRAGQKSGEIMLCLVINAAKLDCGDALADAVCERFPSIVSVMTNTNTENTNVVLGERYTLLRGRGYIEDELCGLRFKITPQSFYQVNRDGAEILYSLAADLAGLKEGDKALTLCDLYCGTGTIGLSMAKYAKRLVGIEIVESAVECARQNAIDNGINNAEFFCADASDPQTILRCMGGERPDVVVIDPPRKGSTRELAECLSDLGVPRIVYVSCNPDTLARDCTYFAELGYEIGDVTPVDMFPRTGHVESVVCLTRRLDN